MKQKTTMSYTKKSWRKCLINPQWNSSNWKKIGNQAMFKSVTYLSCTKTKWARRSHQPKDRRVWTKSQKNNKKSSTRPNCQKAQGCRLCSKYMESKRYNQGGQTLPLNPKKERLIENSEGSNSTAPRSSWKARFQPFGFMWYQHRSTPIFRTEFTRFTKVWWTMKTWFLMSSKRGRSNLFFSSPTLISRSSQISKTLKRHCGSRST